MSVNWNLKEWTANDFQTFCKTLDKETEYFLKEFIAARITKAEARAERAEQEVSAYRWERDARLGYIQGSN